MKNNWLAFTITALYFFFGIIAIATMESVLFDVNDVVVAVFYPFLIGYFFWSESIVVLGIFMFGAMWGIILVILNVLRPKKGKW